MQGMWLSSPLGVVMVASSICFAQAAPKSPDALLFQDLISAIRSQDGSADTDQAPYNRHHQKRLQHHSSHAEGATLRLAARNNPQPEDAGEPTDDLPDKKRVKDLVEAVMACKHVPGLSVAVVKQGATLAEGYGFKDVATKTPADSSTLFGIGSLTKALTSALLAIALEEAQAMGMNVSWQTKLRDLFGKDFELTNHLEQEVTLGDVLAHRTGLYNVDILAVAGYPAGVPRKQFIRQLRHLPAFSFLQHRLYYNNWMYALAGDVTELLLGNTWQTSLKDRLLSPLGMNEAMVVWDDVNVTSPSMAQPYQLIRGSLKLVDESLFELRQGRPAGALAVSADDMAKWMSFMLRGGVMPSGDRLISPKLVADMTTSHVRYVHVSDDVPVEDKLLGYGYGWFTASYRGKRTLTHTGGWFGYQCILTLFPDDDVAVYVATSGPGTDDGIAAFRTISYFLSDLALGYSPWLNQTTACAFGEDEGKEDEGHDEEDKSNALNTTVQARIQSPERYIGRYQHPLFGEVVIKNSPAFHHGLILQLQRLEGFLIPWEKDEFEFWVQYTGKTEFYSVENFNVHLSQLSFSRHVFTSDGKCTALVIRGPEPDNHEKLVFTRVE